MRLAARLRPPAAGHLVVLVSGPRMADPGPAAVPAGSRRTRLADGPPGTVRQVNAAESKPVDIKPRSRDVTDGLRKAPSRAMLRAVGMTDDDWVKPQVGVA